MKPDHSFQKSTWPFSRTFLFWSAKNSIKNVSQNHLKWFFIRLRLEQKKSNQIKAKEPNTRDLLYAWCFSFRFFFFRGIWLEDKKEIGVVFLNLNLIKTYCRKKLNHRHSSNFDGMLSRGRYFIEFCLFFFVIFSIYSPFPMLPHTHYFSSLI